MRSGLRLVQLPDLRYFALHNFVRMAPAFKQFWLHCTGCGCGGITSHGRLLAIIKLPINLAKAAWVKSFGLKTKFSAGSNAADMPGSTAAAEARVKYRLI